MSTTTLTNCLSSSSKMIPKPSPKQAPLCPARERLATLLVQACAEDLSGLSKRRRTHPQTNFNHA